MRLRQAPRHSLQHLQPPRRDSRSWTREPRPEDGAGQTEGRHDSQMLVARSVPIDPYTVWLAQHEATRLSQPTRRPSRITRRRRAKAPWESMLVTLTPEGTTNQWH